MEKLAAYVVRKGALSARDAVGWIVRLTQTLTPMHGLDVAHGRVSPKAILIDAPRCESDGYLLDAEDLVDDPAYFSPERVRDGASTPADDAWAVGVSFYRMLTGQLPFPGTRIDEVAMRIAKHPPSPLAVYDVGDDDLQLLVDRLLATDGARRLRDLQVVRDTLIKWNTGLGLLSPLRYGRPDAPGRGVIDDEEEITTAVFRMPPEVLRAKPQQRVEHRMRAAPPRSPPPDPKPVEHHIRAAPPRSVPPDPKPVAPRASQPPEEDPAKVLARDPARALTARPFRPGPKRKSFPDLEPDADIRQEMRREEPPSVPPPRDREISAPPLSQPSVVSRLSELEAPLTENEPPSSSRRSMTGTYVLAGILGLAGAGIVWTLFTPSQTPSGADSSAPSVKAPARSSAPVRAVPSAMPKASAVSTASAAPSQTAAPPPVAAPAPDPAPSASAAPVPAPAPDLPPPGNLHACVVELFPAGSFSERAKLEFVCAETNPIKGAQQFHTQIVLSGGGAAGVTDAMKEWSNIGWYGMAAFGIARARCCRGAKPLDTPAALDTCKLDERIEQLGNTVFGSDEAAAKAALDQYNKAVYCLARGGTAHLFGQEGTPKGGELEIFERTFKRARALAK